MEKAAWERQMLGIARVDVEDGRRSCDGLLPMGFIIVSIQKVLHQQCSSTPLCLCIKVFFYITRFVIIMRLLIIYTLLITI
jgi:hypothetical protein